MIDLENMNDVAREAAWLCSPLAFQISEEVKSQEWGDRGDPKGARLARLRKSHPELAQEALDACRRWITEDPSSPELRGAWRDSVDAAAVAMARDEIGV